MSCFAVTAAPAARVLKARKHPSAVHRRCVVVVSARPPEQGDGRQGDRSQPSYALLVSLGGVMSKAVGNASGAQQQPPGVDKHAGAALPSFFGRPKPAPGNDDLESYYFLMGYVVGMVMEAKAAQKVLIAERAALQAELAAMQAKRLQP